MQPHVHPKEVLYWRQIYTDATALLQMRLVSAGNSAVLGDAGLTWRYIRHCTTAKLSGSQSCFSAVPRVEFALRCMFETASRNMERSF